jgi:hypothetical protein
MQRRHEELVARLSRTLDAAGFSVLQNFGVGGIQTDLMISTPSGNPIIVEAKAFRPIGENIDAAISQADLYVRELGASRAFVVVDRLEYSIPEKGVFAARDIDRLLIPEIRLELAQFGVPASRAESVSARVRPIDRTIFAAMPFSSAYSDTYFVAMSHAAEVNAATCVRVDHEEFIGDVVDQIKRLIRESVAVIADLSESRPNVLYETGYAHALEKPTIHICSTPFKDLPFDVRNQNTLRYRKGQTSTLREPLGERLRAILS